MAFVVQTLVFIMVPRFSENGPLQAKPTVTWVVRSIFSTAAFLLWLLLHYRDRDEVSVSGVLGPPFTLVGSRS